MSAPPDADPVRLPIPLGASGEARHFYQFQLGLTAIRDPLVGTPGVLRFALDRQQQLDLRETPHTAARPPTHLAIVVSDLPSLLERLRYFGLPVRTEPGHGRAQVKDPFGNRLDLLSRPREALAPPGETPHVSQLRFAR